MRLPNNLQQLNGQQASGGISPPTQKPEETTAQRATVHGMGAANQ
jgi:hypothetical protein